MSAPLLVLEDLQLGYRGRVVISGLNLAMDRGRWVALVGPNASGKTTLLRAIAGRHEPARGRVKIDGQLLYPGSARRSTLPGFAIPTEELPPFLTARQCLDIYANAHGLAAPPPECMALFDLLGLDAHSTTLVRQASLGTRQKLAIVLAMMMPTPLLLLDEVFNGLDFSSALKLRAHLRECVDHRGLTVLLATHSLDVVLRCCDEVILLDSGRLVKRWEMSSFAGADGLGALEHALAEAGN
jgi:ABC-type multidrug transport system ATPase subunit